MQGKRVKQKRERTARIIIGAVLVVAVFLSAQLATLFMQSSVYDYEYYLMDELKQSVNSLWLQLEDAPQEMELGELLDGMERYFSTHDITDNTFNTRKSTKARFTMTMQEGEAAEQELFSYDREQGFVRLLQGAQQISSRDMAQAIAEGTYLSVRDDGTASPMMYAAVEFQSDGVSYTLRVAVPANEPVLRTLPVILGVVACVVVLVALVFLFLWYNQSMFYRQAVQQANRTQLVLDHLSTSVQVSRVETGELLFMNKAMREEFDLSEEDIGKPCWEVLKRDMRSRCQYCPLYQLQGDPTKSVTWELWQGDTGKCYMNTDALIEWDDGSTVMMEHATDVTEQKRTLQRMRQQIEQQKLVSQLSIEVATNMGQQQLVDHLLSELGTFLDLDRVWVMRNIDDTGRMEYLYEWHKPQLRSISTYVSEMVLTLYGEGKTAKLDTNVKLVPMPQNLPVTDTTPFEEMRLYSNAYVSLMVGGKPWGLLCLAMQERTREWTQGDVAFVRTFSGILATALQNALIQGWLQETQQMLRSVLEHIPLGIYWKDKDSHYMGANQRYLTMMGLEQNQIEGLTDAELFPEKEATHSAETDQIALRTGDIYEDTIRTGHDTHLPERWLRRKKLAVWEADGQLAFILGIVEDITDQRNAEKRRDESLSMLRAAMQNYPGILFSLDEDHRIVVMGGKSPFGQQDTAQGNEGLLGRPVEEVYAKYPEMVSRILATYAEGAQNFSISEENAVYNFFTAQILGPEGAITGVVVTGLDMTREMELRQELEEAIVTAESASSAKSDFLSRMSHEIRTPMNVIIGMCRMALRAKDPAKVKHSLLQIDASAKHLLGLINDILDMSKIEANKLVLHNEPFDIEKTLMEVCAGVQVRAGEKHQTIQVLLARGMPHCFIGDELRLSQVITNLFTNAIKFSPEHGNIVLSMKVLETEGDVLTLETRVRDHGIGMTQEQIDKLFVSFEQADGGIARKYGGTGLGLAICKSIVTMMDGDIWAESEYGKGSTFVFTVKMQVSADQAKADTGRDLKAQNLHTLVVDDSVETCDYIIGIMEGFGIACDKALSGQAALDLVARENKAGTPYDIVFVDWQMPDMDGIETIRKLRELSPAQVPVIMISSSDLSEVEDEAKAMGVRHFVPKPLFPSDLFNVVHNILGLGSITPTPKNDTTTVGSAPNLSGHVILLAEDMEFNREVAIGILEETGCGVDEAINGMEAVEKFEADPTRYSCILMDMQMPGVDGLEATRMIRAMKNIPWAKKVPIIAMTANVFKDDIEECLEAGMDDHIGKPISDSVLYEKLAFYLHSADNMRRTEPEAEPEEEMVQSQDMSPETFLPYIGVEEGLGRLRDNKKLYSTLLGSFLRNTKAEELLAQIRDGDLAEAAKTAHALKGIAGNIELAELYRMTSEMDEVLKVGTRPADSVTEAFAETYQKTMDLVPQVIQYLSKGIEG